MQLIKPTIPNVKKTYKNQLSTYVVLYILTPGKNVCTSTNPNPKNSLLFENNTGIFIAKFKSLLDSFKILNIPHLLIIYTITLVEIDAMHKIVAILK